MTPGARVLAATILGSSMAFIDGSVVNVALPAVQRGFGSGVALFAAASLACGLAPGVDVLVGARAVQGVGAALLAPGSLAIIEAAFPETERGTAIGTWSGVGALTTALGPVLGGWLMDRVAGFRDVAWAGAACALGAAAVAAGTIGGRRRTDA